MLLSLLSVLAFSLAGSQIEVADTRSATSYPAELAELTDQAMTVSVGGESRILPLAELRRIKFQSNSAERPSPIEVSFQDGSSLNVDSVTSEGGKSTLTLPGGLELSVDTQFLANVRLRELSEMQESQWKAIVQSRISADMLVLLRSSESLDKIEGIINGIGREAVDFEFSGQKIPAPLSKLAGVRFFSNADPASAKLAAVLHGTRGGTLNASHLVSSDGQTLEIRLQCGLEMRLPVSEISEIDFSVGSMKFVADLEPLSRSAVSRFDLGIQIEGAEQVFGARVVSGRKLPPSIEFLGSGTATYRVPKDFQRLVGTVELAPPGSKLTPCAVKILVEKKVVWEERLTEAKQPERIDIAVQGDQRVQLVVQAESRTPVGDVVLFRELRFLK